MKIQTALISVSDKRGVADFAKHLVKGGVTILSTGGTAKALSEAGVSVTEVADYTGAPEILDGRVKTLHPKIHGGLLGRSTPDHQTQMKEQGINAIDLVVVNLYPFEKTVSDSGVAYQDAIENIDIGGPSMLRSGAKNHERVAVVVDPSDYDAITRELDASSDWSLSQETRQALAVKAFSHTAAYDGAIAGYLSSKQSSEQNESQLPPVLTVQWQKSMDLRYGENPHQQAAFYKDSRSALSPSSKRSNVCDAKILQGKALSYNNILDLDAALACVLEFDKPAAVVVKHTNPCGVARNESLVEAYRQARACDPTSAFGGIVAVNRPVDAKLASEFVETFLECIVAPSYNDDALKILAAKKNLRLCELGDMKASTEDKGWAMRSVNGGMLVQTADYARLPISEARVVTKRKPTEDELKAVDMAWRVVKHVKSNAILFCQSDRSVAVGAGQMSRVDSSKIAKLKAQIDLKGSVVASDAFFPFRDGVDVLAEAGASCVIQPGGSRRDEEVIAAADEHGLAMLMTGMRHFRH